MTTDLLATDLGQPRPHQIPFPPSPQTDLRRDRPLLDVANAAGRPRATVEEGKMPPENGADPARRIPTRPDTAKTEIPAAE